MRERMTPAERRKQLLEISYACFSEQGYVGTTVTDIVKRAGVAKGTFFYYFPTKEDIFMSLVKDEMERLVERLRRTGKNKSGIERLQLTLNMIQEPNRIEPIIDKMYESGELRILEASWKIAQSMFDQELRAIITQGVTDGTMHVDDIGIAIEFYWAIVDRMLEPQTLETEVEEKRFVTAVRIIEYILGIQPNTLV